MIALIILLAATAIGLHFVIPVIAKGAAAESRFIERSKDLPNGKMFTAANFKAWVRANPDDARQYAIPVIVPMDLFFMAAFGGFMAASGYWLYQAMTLNPRYAWVVLVIPIAYVVIDLIEDVIAVGMLRSPAKITPSRFATLDRLTKLKFVAASLGQVQTAGLAAAGLCMIR